jgi:hypothetical protein
MAAKNRGTIHFIIFWAAGTLTAGEREEWASLQARQAAAKGAPSALESPPKR